MSPLYSTNPDVFLELHKYNAKVYEAEAARFHLTRCARQNQTHSMDVFAHRFGAWLIRLGEMLQRRTTHAQNFIEPRTTMFGIK
ncbi:MAG: hypothetical protein JXA25_06485 [Anaerolineales bacterium]|nr:hypothetical protein [Anaerolineales bacterium]